MVDALEALVYLKQFGYIASPTIEEFGFGIRKAFVAAPANVEDTERKLAEALVAFQRYLGLPETGELDAATEAMMLRKRCGFPDVGQFVLQGNRWPSMLGGDLTYSFLELSGDIPEPALRQAIVDSFRLWSDVANVSFREAAPGEIVIRFVHAEHGDGFGFDGASGVLAHAFFPPPNGGALAGDCHFDDAETWSVAGGGVDLVSVAGHEIGHALGLAHSSVQGSLMYPYYSGPQRTLHPDDVAGIQALYGARVQAPIPPAPPPPPPPPPPVPPAPPSPPPSFFAVRGSRVFHDVHRVLGTVDRRYETYAQAVAAGLRPCLICRPRP